jgi:hypothetical protein
VDLPNPDAGTYQVIVDVYSGTTAFDVTTFSVLPGAGDGAFTVNPTTLSGAQGEPIAYTASWSGLTPNTDYLGIVSYGDTGRSTLVSVASGDAPPPDAPVNTAPPTISGTPVVGQTLTASPGTWSVNGLTFAYQWQRAGADIAGATGATYQVVNADQGASITVVVTASKDGLPSASATSAAVVVKYASTVKLSLNRSVAFSWQQVKATVTVSSVAPTPPSGEVTVTVAGQSIPVVLDARGVGRVVLPKLGWGVHIVRAAYSGNDTIAGSASVGAVLWVVF